MRGNIRVIIGFINCFYLHLSMEQQQLEDTKISKYSSGVNIIIRLDGLWKDANNHSRLGLFQKWNNDLDRIWCELARDLKDDEYNSYKNTFDTFDKKIADIGKFEDNAGDSFEPLKEDQIGKRNRHYKTLMEKDLFLRRLENHLGKGTTFEDESDDDFD